MKKLYGLFFVIATCVAVGLGTGCTTTKTVTNADGSTTTTKVYDPVKTEQTKAAITPAITTGVHVLFEKNRGHADELAKYIGAGRDIFCAMVQNKNFSPDYLVEQANKLGTPELVKAIGEKNGQYVIAAKDLAINLYRIHLADKGNVALTDEDWGYQVASLFCESLTTALKDEGY